MLQLDGIKQSTIYRLEFDGWTEDALAVATARDLTPIPTIGRSGARQIIQAAQDFINARNLAESKKFVAPVVEPIVAVEPEAVGPPESERVRRIRESMEK